MTNPIAKASGEIRPGLRITITLASSGRMDVVWNHDVPKRLTPAEVGRYCVIHAQAVERARQRVVVVAIIEA